MFTIVRGVLIIAAIFYFSPVRNAGDERPAEAQAAGSPTAAARGSSFLVALWNSFAGDIAEDAVRTSAETYVGELGLRLSDASAARRLSAGASWTGDARADAKDDQGPSVRCVYRCDGAE
jgi:hypothetical protein